MARPCSRAARSDWRFEYAEPERDAALVDHDRRPETVRPIAAERRGEGFGETELARIERHADLSVTAEPVQLRDLGGGRDAACDGDRSVAGRLANALGEIEIGALEPALALDEGDEEAAYQIAQLGDPLEDALPGRLLPALDDDLAVAGIERRDHPLARQHCQQIGAGGGAQHDLDRAAVKPADRAVDVADAAADPTGR